MTSKRAPSSHPSRTTNDALKASAMGRRVRNDKSGDPVPEDKALSGQNYPVNRFRMTVTHVGNPSPGKIERLENPKK